MPSRLIVNADDFGLTRGINRAVAELFDAGALTSATLMANGPAFEDAVHIARTRPALGVGCHVVLTDGTPISDPRSIPSLLGRDNRNFRPSLHTFIGAVLSTRIPHDELTREITAQIEHLQRAGLRVTHLDTHKHTHVLPPVAKALLQAAERTGVPAIRNPFEQPWSMGNTDRRRASQVHLVRLLKWRVLSLPQIKNGSVHTSDGTIGVSATGKLNEPSLRAMLNVLPEGTWELVCHPGYNDVELHHIQTRLRETRDIERQALLAVLAPQHRNDSSPSTSNLPLPQLIHYGHLTPTPH